MLSKFKSYVNFSLELRAYVRNVVTEDEAKQIILEQREKREENFLRGLRKSVFEYPQSPYLVLFRAARLSYSDVEKMVLESGLESTLASLYEAGIYVTFEEFKGRVPIKRAGVEFSPRESDFDNLNLSAVISGSSGGSSGQATRSRMDLDHIAQNSEHVGLCLGIHGIFDSPKLIWWGMLPDAMGLMSSLSPAHFGQRVHRWFATFRGNEANTGWRFVMMTYLVIFMARFHGLKIPFPESVPLDDPLPIARALAETVQKRGSAFMVTAASKCVRICIAARNHSIDLAGVTFLGSSEPITPAKHAAVLSTGARYISIYAATETGHIGLPCRNPADATDVHFMSNNLAMIQRPREILGQGSEALYFTSLLPTNPKLMINVESDDFGIVEERDCGCPFHELGFTTHIRQIGSFSKLTGEGVTLIGSDMEFILEHVLPTQFGGSLLDYQLLEEEGDDGLTRLVLIVDPSVPVPDETALAGSLLDAMKHSVPSARLAQAEYRTGDVIEVRREKPVVTGRGKQLLIRTLDVNQ